MCNNVYALRRKWRSHIRVRGNSTVAAGAIQATSQALSLEEGVTNTEQAILFYYEAKTVIDDFKCG